MTVRTPKKDPYYIEPRSGGFEHQLNVDSKRALRGGSAESDSKTVALTGINGYLGTHIALQLLEKGYQVRGIVRSENKAKLWEESFPQWKSKLEWRIVPDIVPEGAFNDAMDGDIFAVIHAASPLDFSIADLEKLVRPAREGTLNALKAAKRNTRIRHVVVTSSYAAMVNLSIEDSSGYTYDEKDWCNLTPDSPDVSNPRLGYFLSKKQTEKAAWSFLEDEEQKNGGKATFTLTTLCCTWIFGPPFQPGIKDMNKDLNESMKSIWELMNYDGNLSEVPQKTFVPFWVDVRDAARAHVLSIETPAAYNQRYFITHESPFSWNQTVQILSKALPTHPHLPYTDSAPPPYHKADTTKARKDLGIEWRSFEECITDTAVRLDEIDSGLRSSNM